MGWKEDGMRRFILGAAAIVAAIIVTAQPAAACAGLIGPNGAVNLLRTTTFAGYHDGIEHYVTAFKFQGGSGQFGSLVPLPGVPTSVEKGGDWTLQRLIRETEFAKRLRAPVALSAQGGAREDAQVLLQVKIDALDITVLKGGGEAVGRWATEHGFRLPPDAPEVLDFYAARSPIFMAAIFDADAAKAKGQEIGDGTPVHITIPTANPWVPLRILGTGKTGDERIEADVYLLTDRKPTLMPAPFANGMELEHSATASASLLDDLRSDKGMEWVPEMAWLTKIGINASAKQLTYDLAVSANGTVPSRVAAGLEAPATNTTTGTPTDRTNENLVLAGIAIAGLGTLLLIARFAPRNVKP
jgi:hypothetical protein